MSRALILVVLVITGCHSDPVQKDLLHYLNDGLVKIQQASDDVVKDFEVVSSAGMDAQAATAKIDDIIGRYQKVVDQATALHPATADVQKLHALFLDVMQQQLDAFKLAKDTYKTNDAAGIKQVNEKIDGAKAARDLYLAERARLAKAHAVALK